MVEDAVSLAATLGAHLSAVSCEVRVRGARPLPRRLDCQPARDRRRRGRKEPQAAPRTCWRAFDAAAEKAGVLHEIFLEKCPTYKVPDLLVDYARLRDLTIMPVPESYDQWYADTVIFASGRPILVSAGRLPRARPLELGTVVSGLGFQPRRSARGFRRASLARDGQGRSAS